MKLGRTRALSGEQCQWESHVEEHGELTSEPTTRTRQYSHSSGRGSRYPNINSIWEKAFKIKSQKGNKKQANSELYVDVNQLKTWTTRLYQIYTCVCRLYRNPLKLIYSINWSFIQLFSKSFPNKAEQNGIGKYCAFLTLKWCFLLFFVRSTVRF